MFSSIRITLLTLVMLLVAYSFALGQLYKEFGFILENPNTSRTLEGAEGQKKYFSFENAYYHETDMLPLWTKKISIPNYSKIELVLEDEVYFPLNGDGNWKAENISDQAKWTATASYFKGQPFANITIMPIRKNTSTGQYEYLKSARVKVFLRPDLEHQRLLQSTYRRANQTNSSLSSGNIYKIALSETGVYKMSYTFLKDLGVDVDNIDPRNIQLFGNGGRMIPQTIGDPATIDDLRENAIYIAGEGDGKFDAQDYILFFAEGVEYWNYNSRDDFYYKEINDYTSKTYFYLKVNGSNNPKRIDHRSASGTASYTTSSYDARYTYEKEEISLMKDFFPLPPSGRLWVSNPFQITRNQNFTVNIPNRILNAPVRLNIKMLARFFNGSGGYDLTANGQRIGAYSIGNVSSYVYSLYANSSIKTIDFVSNIPTLNLGIKFNQESSAAEAWLDYFSINTRASIVYNGHQLLFSDRKTIGENGATYQLSNAGEATIWDVTDRYNAIKQSTTNNSFTAPTDKLREFIIFDQTNVLTPNSVGSVPNQNLHAITKAPNLLILYHKDFAAAATRLANHRANHSDLSVLTIDVKSVYNEFGSGMPDVTAIRNFIQMLYSRSAGNDSLLYVLLMGDGTYDYKGINNQEDINPNFIPVYETLESLAPLGTYTSDDFFALLDPGEGNLNSNQDLDIAVGRLPVKTITEANQVVDKIMYYDLHPNTLRDWRNRLIFIADDEDGNTHINDADGIANNAASINNTYNQDKIYIDAYVQQSTSGGSRYPDVNDAIMRGLFKGALIVNYLGHGGNDGWAQERIFTNAEITTLQNKDKLPLFITATCSFAPFDDPSDYSAGELLILNPEGGASALLTTVRVVLTTANEHLTQNTFNQLFRPINGRMPTVGEILQYAKNSSGILSASNSRKFVLLGDPSMTLAYPKYNVVTTEINNRPVGQATQDTIQALQYVTIKGELRDDDNNLMSDFNGIVSPTVFDKIDTMSTRKNDAGSYVRNFLLQKKIIFNGSATVKNGQFQFSFVVPLDINYKLGHGKISYYAFNENGVDAHGAFHDIVIGGTSSNAVEDNKGPLVKVYMNNEDFASGGTTDTDPLLLIKLEDENGINTVGNGIGHDLTATLTYTVEDQVYNYILNDFYEADVDSFQKGTVRFPLSDLPEGLHHINIKAWDVYNNKGEGETEFVVAPSAEMALSHVLNYPNPFVNSTEFMFEHNLPNQDLDVLVQIYTVSGNLVKSINHNVAASENDGYRIRGIKWDGLDDFGDRIGNGVYIYKVTVKAISTDATDDEKPTIQQESTYQKLVLLK